MDENKKDLSNIYPTPGQFDNVNNSIDNKPEEEKKGKIPFAVFLLLTIVVIVYTISIEYIILSYAGLLYIADGFAASYYGTAPDPMLKPLSIIVAIIPIVLAKFVITKLHHLYKPKK